MTSAVSALAGLVPPSSPSSAGKAGSGEEASFEGVLMGVLVKEVLATAPESDMMSALAPALTEHLVAAQQGGSRRRAVASFSKASGVIEGRVSSRFGKRIDPIDGTVRTHQGVDVAAPVGTPIRVARAGTVRFAGSRGGYGTVAIIDHGGGLETRYAHCSALLVQEGERVRAGDVIARVGATGRATGPHLHLEARRHGVPVDPAPFLHGDPADPGSGAKAREEVIR